MDIVQPDVDRRSNGVEMIVEKPTEDEQVIALKVLACGTLKSLPYLHVLICN